MPYVTVPLEQSGAFIKVFLAATVARQEALKKAGRPVPPPVQATLLIDTGASGTVLDRTIIAALQLQPTGTVSVHTPSTGQVPAEVNQYDVSIHIPDFQTNRHLSLTSIPVMDADFSMQGFGGLLGRDVLGRCLLVYDGQSKQFTLAF